MSDVPDSPWEVVNPPEMAKPIGYANAIVSKGGRRISIAGQIDMGTDGKVRSPGDLEAQVKGAFENLSTVLRAVDAKPEHIVRMRIYVADADEYASRGKAIGAIYRSHFGRWFPAMTLVQVSRLFDEHALIEVEAEAVVPE